MLKIQDVLTTIQAKLQKIKNVIFAKEELIDYFVITNDGNDYEETVTVSTIDKTTDIVLTFERNIKLDNGDIILLTYSSHILPAVVAEKLYTLLFKAKHSMDS